MDGETFYGPEQARIHHEEFGRLADRAADLLVAELARAGVATGTVVDLGCGSGILARRMLAAGYDVLGSDLSESMLEIARRQAPGARLVRTSLLDLALPPCVAVAATGEALNYATDPRAGDAAFGVLARRIHDALAPGGIFLFDVSVPGRAGPDRRRVQFHDVPAWSVGVVETEGADALTRIITTFRRQEDGRYERSDERHLLHLYDTGELLAVLADSGFTADPLDDYDGAGGMPGWVVIRARRA